VLVCAGMPMPPAGKAYQLWFIEGERKMPGGTFAPEADGTCMFSDRVPDDGRDADVFAVTLEPASGVREPTGEMFLVGNAS
ncbi:MAG: anti-sigma factor, partial [Candidatus Binatia bacterium]